MTFQLCLRSLATPLGVGETGGAQHRPLSQPEEAGPPVARVGMKR